MTWGKRREINYKQKNSGNGFSEKEIQMNEDRFLE